MALYTTMLESLATLKRSTTGRDAKEGVTQDPFVVIASNLPCSVEQSSTNVQLLYAQRNTFVSTTIYFVTDPGARVNDRLEILSRQEINTGGNPTIYLVRGEARQIGRGPLWAVDAQWVQAPS